MKIALALEQFDPRRGGLETWTSQFADRLLAAGHEVHIVACGRADPGEPRGIHFHPIERSASPWHRAAALERVLRTLSMDVIHDMGCGWHADLFHPHGGSTIAAREHNLMRIPRWRQFRLWQEKRYREQRQIEKRQHACTAALLIALSQRVRDHFRKIHLVAEERIRLIPNGVDPTRFSPDHRALWRDATRRSLLCSDADTLFLMVAHNLRLKNAETAIRAFARLAGEGAAVRLAVVGGKKPAPFVRLVEKLEMTERVSFVAPTEDVRPYYAAADVQLHPTWYDPCSLVGLEALASGLPLITSHYNGVSEMMTDGKQGVLLPHPADGAALLQAMRGLLEAGSRSVMGAAARELALCQTFDGQTQRFLTLYEEIRNRKSAQIQ
jgi:UDP-glucose:(heptosyl)LPS alpha-1,3-glucosyltransferase